MEAADRALAERVRAAVKDVIARHHLPGYAIGVVRGDDLIFAEAFGYADIESGEALDPSRRHAIASVTKTMVGLCIMALVDEGKLRLDERVVDLLPEIKFHGPAETMTVRHLVTHTSGMGEAANREGLRSVANPDRSGVAGRDFDQLFPDGIVVEVPPGTKWAYCNIGFGCLGEIVVRREGASLQDVMHRRIWSRLGMVDTDVRAQSHPALTTGYHREQSADARFQFERAGIEVPEEKAVDGHNIRGVYRGEFERGMLGAGAVQSTIADMARYGSALLRRGAGIVKPETFDAMVAPQWAPDPRLITWGLAFSRLPHFGTPLFGHGGSFLGGWNTFFAVMPQRNLAVIQFMNLVYDYSRVVFSPVLSAVLDQKMEPLPQRRVDPAVLAAAPGRYSCPMPGNLTNFRPANVTGRIEIVADGDGLVLRSRWGAWKDGVPLDPCDDNDATFFALQAKDIGRAYIALTREPDGSISGLRFDELVRMVRD